jgi:hypothetical protein
MKTSGRADSRPLKKRRKEDAKMEPEEKESHSYTHTGA